jgi:hypothetical protein
MLGCRHLGLHATRGGVETWVIQACPTPLPGGHVEPRDAALIEDVIGNAPLCASCIVRKTGLQQRRLNVALPDLIGALRVASAMGGCGACLKQTVVHRLT